MALPGHPGVDWAKWALVKTALFRESVLRRVVKSVSITLEVTDVSAFHHQMFSLPNIYFSYRHPFKRAEI